MGTAFLGEAAGEVAISFLLLNKTIYSLFRACVQIRGHPFGGGGRHLSEGLIDRKGSSMGGSGRNNF